VDVLSTLLAAAVLAASAVGLAATLLIVTPAPTSRLWLLGILAEGYSLVLAGAAVVAMAIAAVAIGMGAAVLGWLAIAVSTAVLVVALVPVAEGRRAARSHDVRLSLRSYWAAPTWIAAGSSETMVFSTPRDVPDGLAVDVRQPAGTGPEARPPIRAAVVLVHGGGWVSGSRGGVARWNEWLADLGYVVFDVDYRLAPPPRWQDAADDVDDAVAWVRANATRFGVDRCRIGLVGWSAGGHLALLSAYRARRTAKAVAAVAAVYPITDVGTAARGVHPRWAIAEAESQVDAFLGGPAADHADSARLASPITHVDAAVPPTFLAHGTRDQLVNVAHSDALAAALRQVGADHQLVRLPGANHSYDLVWGAWSTQVTRAVLGRFLERHLGAPFTGRRTEP
jgi:acetyl esterase/lipase